MSSRTRQKTRPQEEQFDPFEEELDLDLAEISDDELEELLFDDEEEEKKSGLFNLPTMAGLSMIVVGMVYVLQQLGVLGSLSLGPLIGVAPFVAGVLIILIGFGVLSWRPKKKKRRSFADVERTAARPIQMPPLAAPAQQATAPKIPPRPKTTFKPPPAIRSRQKKRLRKAGGKDKKISGVCAGIAEYFHIDPTLVRIAFVIGTILWPMPPIVPIAYLLLSFIMAAPEKQSLPKPPSSPNPPKSVKSMSDEEKWRIIRDS